MKSLKFSLKRSTQTFWIWLSLSCVPWKPGYTLHMTNLTRSDFFELKTMSTIMYYKYVCIRELVEIFHQAFFPKCQNVITFLSSMQNGRWWNFAHSLEIKEMVVYPSPSEVIYLVQIMISQTIKRMVLVELTHIYFEDTKYLACHPNSTKLLPN